MPIKVEQKDGVWNVDFGGGIEQDFRDRDDAIRAAHEAAARDGCGYLIVDDEDRRA